MRFQLFIPMVAIAIMYGNTMAYVLKSDEMYDYIPDDDNYQPMLLEKRIISNEDANVGNKRRAPAINSYYPNVLNINITRPSTPTTNGGSYHGKGTYLAPGFYLQLDNTKHLIAREKTPYDTYWLLKQPMYLPEN